MITLDTLFALLFAVLLVFGAREFAFVFLLFYLSLAVFTYNTAVRRDTKLLWLFTVLHVIPGFNLLVGPLALLVAWVVRSEVVKYAVNESGAD